MNKKWKTLIKSAGFFFLLFYFPSVVALLLPINVSDLTENGQYIFKLVCNFVFLIWIIASYFKDIKKDFKSFFKNFSTNFEISFKYWLVGFIIMICSNLVISVLTDGKLAPNEELVRNLIGIAPLYMIFSISIYAPIAEEMVFRKSFSEILKNKYAFVLISGITFGSLHVTGAITSLLDLLYLIPYCALGIAFAYTYQKTKNIFSTIIMHMFHNTMALVLFLIGSLL